jgi:hypothetical protein
MLPSPFHLFFILKQNKKYIGILMAKLRKMSMSPSTSSFDLRKMCTPATIYFVISLIFLILIGVSNLKETDRLCVGDYSCYVGNNTLVFLLNAIYILFWTFILDLMCKNGYSSLSWFVLLLPFLLSLFLLAFMLFNSP